MLSNNNNNNNNNNSNADPDIWDMYCPNNAPIAPGHHFHTITMHSDDEEHSAISRVLTAALPPSHRMLEVRSVYNPQQHRAFQWGLDKCLLRAAQTAFQTQLGNEACLEERRAVLEYLASHKDVVPSQRLLPTSQVRVMRVWHGTSLSVAYSILDSGFAALSSLDEGWYGSGLYFTTHPEYALRYASRPEVLLMCYATVFNPFPIVHADACADTATGEMRLRFCGKGAFRNFGCHYVRVRRHGSDDSLDYRPADPPTSAECDELVLFQEEHVMPRYLVLLESTHGGTEGGAQAAETAVVPRKWTTDDVATRLGALGLSKDYSDLLRTSAVDGTVLMSMETKDDWNELGITVFGDVRKLVAFVKDLHAAPEPTPMTTTTPSTASSLATEFTLDAPLGAIVAQFPQAKKTHDVLSEVATLCPDVKTVKDFADLTYKPTWSTIVSDHFPQALAPFARILVVMLQRHPLVAKSRVDAAVSRVTVAGQVHHLYGDKENDENEAVLITLPDGTVLYYFSLPTIRLIGAGASAASGNTMLIYLDISSSMNVDHKGSFLNDCPDVLDSSIAKARALLCRIVAKSLRAGTHVDVVLWNHVIHKELTFEPAAWSTLIEAEAIADGDATARNEEETELFKAVAVKLSSFRACGATDTGCAVSHMVDRLRACEAKNRSQKCSGEVSVWFLTDGVQTYYTDPTTGKSKNMPSRGSTTANGYYVAVDAKTGITKYETTLLDAVKGASVSTESTTFELHVCHFGDADPTFLKCFQHSFGASGHFHAVKDVAGLLSEMSDARSSTTRTIEVATSVARHELPASAASNGNGVRARGSFPSRTDVVDAARAGKLCVLPSTKDGETILFSMCDSTSMSAGLMKAVGDVTALESELAAIMTLVRADPTSDNIAHALRELVNARQQYSAAALSFAGSICGGTVLEQFLYDTMTSVSSQMDALGRLLEQFSTNTVAAEGKVRAAAADAGIQLTEKDRQALCAGLESLQVRLGVGVVSQRHERHIQKLVVETSAKAQQMMRRRAIVCTAGDYAAVVLYGTSHLDKARSYLVRKVFSGKKCYSEVARRIERNNMEGIDIHITETDLVCLGHIENYADAEAIAKSIQLTVNVNAVTNMDDLKEAAVTLLLTRADSTFHRTARSGQMSLTWSAASEVSLRFESERAGVRDVMELSWNVDAGTNAKWKYTSHVLATRSFSELGSGTIFTLPSAFVTSFAVVEERMTLFEAYGRPSTARCVPLKASVDVVAFSNAYAHMGRTGGDLFGLLSRTTVPCYLYEISRYQCSGLLYSGKELIAIKSGGEHRTNLDYFRILWSVKSETDTTLEADAFHGNNFALPIAVDPLSAAVVTRTAVPFMGEFITGTTATVLPFLCDLYLGFAYHHLRGIATTSPASMRTHVERVFEMLSSYQCWLSELSYWDPVDASLSAFLTGTKDNDDNDDAEAVEGIPRKESPGRQMPIKALMMALIRSSDVFQNDNRSVSIVFARVVNEALQRTAVLSLCRDNKQALDRCPKLPDRVVEGRVSVTTLFKEFVVRCIGGEDTRDHEGIPTARLECATAIVALLKDGADAGARRDFAKQHIKTIAWLFKELCVITEVLFGGNAYDLADISPLQTIWRVVCAAHLLQSRNLADVFRGSYHKLTVPTAALSEVTDQLEARLAHLSNGGGGSVCAAIPTQSGDLVILFETGELKSISGQEQLDDPTSTYDGLFDALSSVLNVWRWKKGGNANTMFGLEKVDFAVVRALNNDAIAAGLTQTQRSEYIAAKRYLPSASAYLAYMPPKPEEKVYKPMNDESTNISLGVGNDRPHVVTCLAGSPAHGKSTFLGHMLVLGDVVGEHTVTQLWKEAKEFGMEGKRFAWLMDRTRASRQFGRTLDFSTCKVDAPTFQVSLVDIPGQVKYIKNAATGIVGADIAVVIISAVKGETETIGPDAPCMQHVLIAASLGTRNFVIAVNKMDLVGYSQERFEEVQSMVQRHIKRFVPSKAKIVFVPVSAYLGENVHATKSPNMAWYDGPTVLNALDEIASNISHNTDAPLRAVVDNVYKIAGVGTVACARVLQGSIMAGDEVRVVNVHGASNGVSPARSLELHHTSRSVASAGDLVGISLPKLSVSDVARGGVIVAAKDALQPCKSFEARLTILNHSTPLRMGFTPTADVASQHLPIKFTSVISRRDKHGKDVAGAVLGTGGELMQGDVAVVELTPQSLLVVEPFSTTPGLGCITIRDNSVIVAAGIVTSVTHMPPSATTSHTRKALLKK